VSEAGQSSPDEIRYGVFLRPDAATSLVQTQINVAMKQQFNLVSAAAFPPHATLVGNLRSAVGAAELVALLDPVFTGRAPIPVHNSGIVPMGAGYVYDIHHNPDGTTNEVLVSVAGDVVDAVLPIALPTEDYLVLPVGQGSFSAHLSLASHDLAVDPHLVEEVGEYLAALPVTPPEEFTADVFSLYAFRSDWAGHWWNTLTWRHIHSWKLGQ
jgi:hypothetical protein